MPMLHSYHHHDPGHALQKEACLPRLGRNQEDVHWRPCCPPIHSVKMSMLHSYAFIQLRCPCCILTIFMTLGMDFRRLGRNQEDVHWRPCFPPIHSVKMPLLHSYPFIQLRCPCCTLTHSFSWDAHAAFLPSSWPWACTSEGSVPSRTGKEPGGCPLKPLNVLSGPTNHSPKSRVCFKQFSFKVVSS